MNTGKIALFGKLSFPDHGILQSCAEDTDRDTRIVDEFANSQSSDVQKNEDVLRLLELPKVQSLLGWLILHPGEQLRQHCAQALWPNSSSVQALTNLRREIHRLKAAIELLPVSLHLNRTDIGLSIFDSIEIDHEEFYSLIKKLDAAVDIEEQLEFARKALDISSANLLSAVRDDWVAEHRFHISLQRQRIAQVLSTALKVQGHWEESLSACQMRMQIDSADDAAMTDLLECLVQLDRTAEARRLGKTFLDRLAAEMDIKPSDFLKQTLSKLSITDNVVGNEHLPYGTTEFQEIINPFKSGESAQQHLHTPAFKNAPSHRPGDCTTKSPEDCLIKKPVAKSLFIGRTSAIEELSSSLVPTVSSINANRTQRTPNENPQFILVKGESGIGKTRLVEHVLSSSKLASTHQLCARCVRGIGNTPFAALGSIISNSLLSEVISSLPSGHQELLQSVFPLPAIDVPADRFVSSRVGVPGKDRITLFLVIAKIINRLDSNVILFIDDLQWIDRDSLDWLAWFMQQPMQNRVTVLTTQRINEPSFPRFLELFVNGQVCKSTSLVVSLARLGDEDAAKLFDERFAQVCLTGSKFDLNFKSALIDRADGVPLFIEEFAKSAANECQFMEDHQNLKLPSSIVELFAAKFHLLSTNARETSNYAAILGRYADRSILFNVASLDSQQFSIAIEELQEAGILQENSSGFIFNHDLTRDALLDSMSVTRRAFGHHRCALALQQVFHKNLDAVSAAIAVHYDQSDERYKAIEWYVRAAGNAERALALQDGLSLCMSARKHLEHEESLDAVGNEYLLNVYLTETTILSVLQGFGAPRIHDINRKMKALLKTDLPLALQFKALGRMRVTTSFSADCREGISLAQQMVLIAKRSNDPDLLVEAERSLGYSFYTVAKFRDTHEHYKEAFRHAESGLATGYFDVARLPFSVLMMRRSYAKSLVIVGKTRLAVKLNHETDDYPIKHLAVIAQAHILFANCFMNYEYQNPEGLTDALHCLEKLCDVCDIAKIRVIHDIFKGWYQTSKLGSSKGFALMEEACVQYSFLDEEQFFPMWYSMLAQRYYEHGEIRKSLQHVDSGLKISHERHISSALASLYLWKALCIRELEVSNGCSIPRTTDITTVHIARDNAKESRQLFCRALDSAEKAGARLAELRVRLHFYNQFGTELPTFRAENLLILIQRLEKTCDGADMDASIAVKSSLLKLMQSH